MNDIRFSQIDLHKPLNQCSKDFARDLKKMTWRAMELPNLNAEGKSDIGAHAYRKVDVTGIALEQIKVP